MAHLKAREWEILLRIGAERPKRQGVTIYQQSCHLKPEGRELFLLVVVFIRVLNRVVRDENCEESGWDT